MKLRKIISGSQTGADIAGLKAAKIMGLETGGWMLKNFNVYEADCTLRFAINWRSPGELCTARAIKRYGKPSFDVTLSKAHVDNREYLRIDDISLSYFKDRTPQHCYQWLAMIDPEVINVAGNSEQTCPGIEKEATQYLCEVFSLIKQNPWWQYSGCTCQVEDAAGYPTIVLYEKTCPIENHRKKALEEVDDQILNKFGLE